MILEAPFLKELSLNDGSHDAGTFPFNVLPWLIPGWQQSLTAPITFLVGENGTGKSTLLEALARSNGYHESGGGKEHQNYHSTDSSDSILAGALKCSWSIKVHNGFFFRAESFFNLSIYLDEVADLDRYYGGTDMHKQSHGEAFFSLFSNRLGDDSRAFYLMDEPEAALSPNRQLSFLSILKSWQASGNVQAIIATHSPILLALPGAQILEITDKGLRKTTWQQTDHYRTTRRFLENPERYLSEL